MISGKSIISASFLSAHSVAGSKALPRVSSAPYPPRLCPGPVPGRDEPGTRDAGGRGPVPAAGRRLARG